MANINRRALTKPEQKSLPFIFRIILNLDFYSRGLPFPKTINIKNYFTYITRIIPKNCHKPLCLMILTQIQTGSLEDPKPIRFQPLLDGVIKTGKSEQIKDGLLINDNKWMPIRLAAAFSFA
ncbi:hypothetical protein AVEN_35267-1 [Araneus ventricosus]|uniref:Uncharacterized protein n=1 Tax=Araneus ventricosus TaxID=182803 RepID=A0A4Y2EFP3_ARAVE|nr:hypothetical protein AVEN_35267-1 [Araneus ventricosus]